MAVLSFDPRTKKVRYDEEKFLRYLGECVSQWAFLDRALFDLTQTSLGTDDTRTAIVFYHGKTIDNHLALVDRLMKHELPESKFLNSWRPLQKKIIRHLKTRSIYAHHPIKRTGTGKSKAFYYYSIHIEPAEQLLGKTHAGLGGKDELLAKDLRKHAHSLEKLVKEIWEFHRCFRQNRQA